MNRKHGAHAVRLCAAIALASLAGHARAEPAAVASSAEKMTSTLNCSPARIEANRALATLFDPAADPMKAYAKMDPGYIQHNPMAKRIGEVNGLSGRDEFKLLLEMRDNGQGPPPLLPGQTAENFNYFVMADCDHVFLLKKSYQPDPQHPGQFYEAFSFDLWRIKDGKLAEHWDDVRIPPQVPDVLKVPFKDLKKATAKAPDKQPK